MPWYDVRYIQYKHTSDPAPERTLYRGWQKTPARSKAKAVESCFKPPRNRAPLYAKKLKHEWDTRDKTYWYDKWRTAMANMPCKIMNHYNISWEKQAKGETPLPTYIEQRAKGKMKLEEGHVYVLVKTVITASEYGRASNLGILLDYITWTGADHKRKRANSCAMLGRKIPESSRPRSAKARKLLSELGTMDKIRIRTMLKQKRKGMKHD